LMCGPWRKAVESAKRAHHRSLVTPERVLSEYNEDLIFLIFFFLFKIIDF